MFHNLQPALVSLAKNQVLAVVTSATLMAHPFVCYGIWDVVASAPVRPIASHRWTLNDKKMFSLAMFCNLHAWMPPMCNPHATEDLIVSNIKVVGTLSEKELYDEFLKEAKATLNDVFGGNMLSDKDPAKKFVIPGTKCSSVGFVNPTWSASDCLGNKQKQQDLYYQVQLRAKWSAISLPITSLFIRSEFEKRGIRFIMELNSILQQQHSIARVGLARPWMANHLSFPVCYVQFNGIFIPGVSMKW